MEKVYNVDSSDLALACPCRVMICGATLSGKNYLTMKLVADEKVCFNKTFDVIFYCVSGFHTESHEKQYEDLR